MISTTIQTTLNNASAKALATTGNDGINVVPVSMIKVFDDSIWLFDFFMKKSAQNMATNSNVALCAWTAMEGVQIKADVRYLAEGPDFEAAVDWVKTQNPKRVVKGLLILQPTKIFDISPGGVFTEEELSL